MTDIIPYSSIKIDVDPKQYFTLLKNFFKINNREGCQRIIEDSFIRNPEKEKLIVSLSVRTAWDLFLQVCDYPPGSEIIMTSINIPDMARVAREHGYLVVPINVKFDDLAPYPEEFEKAINPRTKAVMLSYVYGTKFPVEEIIKIAKKHNIFIIEDIAEAFRSTDDNGHPETDMSLFSYGTIKHNTALAGAITVIRNNEILYRKMKAIQDQYPVWAKTTYFTKILKNSIPAIMLNSPVINYHGRVIFRALDFDYKEYTVGLVRGFPKDADFLPKFRFQVNNVLMANLAMRMKTFDNKQFQYLIDRIKAGQDILVKGGVEVVGYKAPNRSFWLFPIVVPDIPLCYKMLNEVGVDAYLGATQLKVLEVPEGYKYKPLTETTKYFDQILYLPLGTNVPADEVERICNRTVEVLNKVRAMKNLPTPKL